jgi:hypothetical protein
MHVQIVNFLLKDISEEDYRRQCEAIASAFANLPGLVSKTWLADRRRIPTVASMSGGTGRLWKTTPRPTSTRGC